VPSPWLHGLLHVPGLVGCDVLQGGLGHHQAARVVVVEDVVLADPPTQKHIIHEAMDAEEEGWAEVRLPVGQHFHAVLDEEPEDAVQPDIYCQSPRLVRSEKVRSAPDKLKGTLMDSESKCALYFSVCQPHCVDAIWIRFRPRQRNNSRRRQSQTTVCMYVCMYV